MVLGAEVGVDIDVEFFEAISQMNIITDETFSVSIKTRCSLLVGCGPSKADGWQRKYFFVRVGPSSVCDPYVVLRTEWNPHPGSSSLFLVFWRFLNLPIDHDVCLLFLWHTRSIGLSPRRRVSAFVRICASWKPTWKDLTAVRVLCSIPRTNAGEFLFDWLNCFSWFGFRHTCFSVQLVRK